MKVHDAVVGAVLFVLGVAVLWHIQGYPPMHGQRFGPAWFPGIIAAGMALCGLALVVQGVKSRAPWIVLEAWTRRARPLAGFLSIPVGLGLYTLVANTVGFHLTAAVLLLAWMRILGTRLAVALPMAIVAPVILHLAFYKLLRIPLPWGIFERFAF